MVKLKILIYNRDVEKHGGQPTRVIEIDPSVKNKFLELKENEGYLFFDWEEL